MSPSFHTLFSSASLDISNSTQMEFHGIVLPPDNTITLHQVLSNLNLTQSNGHIVFRPIYNKTVYTSALLPNGSLANLGVRSQTVGNDGYCYFGFGNCGPLTYHSGTVMHNARIIAVFWTGGSFGGCSTSHYFENSLNDPTATIPNDCSYMNLQVRLLQDICSDPFKMIASQYPDGVGGAGPCSVNQSYVDTISFPETTLTGVDIQNEAIRIANSAGAPFDGNTMVLVFTPYDTPSCLDSTHTNCFGTQYCAYHYGDPSLTFASLPVASSSVNCDTISLSPNSDRVSDNEITGLSHELMESLTDPNGGGWYYQNAHEIADECAYDLGTVNSDGSNIHLGKYGNPYVIQKEWSNNNGGCTLSEQSLPAPPSAPPTGIMASPISSSSIGLTWTASIGATSYNVIRYTSNGTVTLASSLTTSFTDTGLSSNSTYHYLLTASNTGGTSARSNVSVSATTLSVPGSPIGLGSNPISANQIHLSWTAPVKTGGSPITGYKIERESPVGGGFFVLVANTGTASTVFLDTGLTANTQYNYRVSALNSVGTSVPSNTATVTTPSACAPPVSGDWTVMSSCTMTSSSIVPANVIVQSGKVLTIPNGLKLTIDFKHHHLIVKSGGGLLIKAGGAIN